MGLTDSEIARLRNSPSTEVFRRLRKRYHGEPHALLTIDTYDPRSPYREKMSGLVQALKDHDLRGIRMHTAGLKAEYPCLVQRMGDPEKGRGFI